MSSNVTRALSGANTAVRGAFLLALAAAASVAMASTAGARSLGTAVGPLKLCTFVSANDNNTTATETVRVQASGATGHKGTLTLKGAGLNHTSQLFFRQGGVALTSFAIEQKGVATLTVKLTAPSKSRTVHVTLDPASTATAATCTPR